jgi:phage gp29-like protein
MDMDGDSKKNEKITDLITELLTEDKFGIDNQFNSMIDIVGTLQTTVENAESYNDLLDNLPSQFKKMDAKKFNEFMKQILLISNIHGRNSIQNEVK